MLIGTNDSYNITPFQYSNVYNPKTNMTSFQYAVVEAFCGRKFITVLSSDVYSTIDGTTYHYNLIKGIFNGNVELWLNDSYVGSFNVGSLSYKDSGGNTRQVSQISLY